MGSLESTEVVKHSLETRYLLFGLCFCAIITQSASLLHQINKLHL